jgi:hypothetical protein
VRDKQRKRELLAERAQADFLAWMRRHAIEPAPQAAAAEVGG